MRRRAGWCSSVVCGAVLVLGSGGAARLSAETLYYTITNESHASPRLFDKLTFTLQSDGPFEILPHGIYDDGRGFRTPSVPLYNDGVPFGTTAGIDFVANIGRGFTGDVARPYSFNFWVNDLLYGFGFFSSTYLATGTITDPQLSGGIDTMMDWEAYPYGFYEARVVVSDTDPAAVATPEPGTLLAVGTGLLGFAGVLRRRRLLGSR